MGHTTRLSSLIDLLRAFAGVTAFITASLLVLEYGALTWGSRVSLAAISCGLVAGLAVRPLRARAARRAPAVRTAVHPAPDGTLWEQGSWDVHVGAMVPVHGYRVDVVDGRIVAAMVAEDGRSVELTFELPPPAS